MELTTDKWELVSYDASIGALKAVKTNVRHSDLTVVPEEAFLIYTGEINEDNVDEVAAKVFTKNNGRVRLAKVSRQVPDHCWCLRVLVGEERERGVLECMYCREDGYCWVVTTSELC